MAMLKKYEHLKYSVKEVASAFVEDNKQNFDVNDYQIVYGEFVILIRGFGQFFARACLGEDFSDNELKPLFLFVKKEGGRLNNHLEQKIITPRIAELVSSNGSDLETKKTSSGQVRAEIQSNNIAGTRLTCCCKYENHIICAGFSGELFFC